MSQDIEQIAENTAPIPPFEQPFKRVVPYEDFVLLNKTQELALPELYRKRKIYYAGIALSGSLIGFTVGFFTSDFSSSTAQFMAGVAVCTNFITFTGLRRRYRREDNFLRLTIQLRYDNKLMRDQDKEELCKFAKTVKMPERVQEIIRSGEYLPYDETEVAAYKEANKPRHHNFTKKQYRHLLFSLLTSRPDLECCMVFGVAIMFLTLALGEQDIIIQVILGLVTALFGSFVIWDVMRSRKVALEACVDGTIDELMAKINTAQPYTFFKVGDHLMHIIITGYCLVSFLTNNMDQSLVKQFIIVIVAMLTLLLTVFAMYRSVQSANRFKAANPNKAK